MRALRQPTSDAPAELLQAWQRAGKPVRSFDMVGWEAYLESEAQPAPLVAGAPEPCRRCSAEGHDARAGHSEDPLRALKYDPQFAWGLHGKELFAGSAGWSRALSEAGAKVDESLELFKDPGRMRGEQKENNLLDKKVQSAVLEEAAAPPGPEVANVWQFGTPCTSFCLWNLLNKGTRTFSHPLGQNPTTAEATGNELAAFTAKCCETLDLHGKQFLFESSAPDGRYPKIWDHPAVARMRAKTGAKIVAMSMCEWGLRPLDQPDKRHRKETFGWCPPNCTPGL